MSGLPRIIHQTYKSADSLGPFKQEWVDSWLEHNPGWERRFWSDADIDAFVQEEFPHFYDVFEEYDQPIKKPDSWRYLALKRIGGVYADMDFACLKPLDGLVEGIGDKYLIAKERDPGSPNTYGNSFMACAPDPDFLKGIEDGFRLKRHMPVLESSACLFITRWIEAGRRRFVHEIDSNLIFPLWWNDPYKKKYIDGGLELARQDFPEAYAITFWSHSWKDQ